MKLLINQSIDHFGLFRQHLQQLRLHQQHLFQARPQQFHPRHYSQHQQQKDQIISSSLQHLQVLLTIVYLFLIKVNLDSLSGFFMNQNIKLNCDLYATIS